MILSNPSKNGKIHNKQPKLVQLVQMAVISARGTITVNKLYNILVVESWEENRAP